MDPLISGRKGKNMNTRYHYFVFITCWVAGAFAGMDANLFSAMLPQSLGELAGTIDRQEISRYGSYILSSFLFGWMGGGLILGIAGDRIGRVKTLAAGVAIFSLFMGAAGACTTPFQLAICRFAIGFGIGGTMVAMSVFLAETWPEKSRAVVLGALITSYQAGVLMSGLAASIFGDWRIAFAFGGAPFILSWIVMCSFCEVPRNKTPQATSHPQGRKALIFGSLIFGSLLIGYWASLSWIPAWIHDLSPNTSEKNTSTIFHGLMAVLGCMASGPLANAFGRKVIVFSAFIGAFIASMGMFLFHSEFSPSIHALNGALGFFAGMAQGVMYIYLPELFSRETRASSVGFCLNAGRLITAIAVLFIGVIVSYFEEYSEALSFFSLVYLVGAGAIWIMPETKTVEFS
jgi:MFS family permease